MDLTPLYRIEYFLDAIVGDSDPLDPLYRVEQYLAKIAGANVELPEAPQTRTEQYLAAIAGQNVIIPETPQTRVETFLAAIAGQDVETPTPRDRIEFWLAEWAEGGSGTWLTVSGIAPITLANALASPMQSLVQYGKCEQATTPTPSVPVDIKCNNGTLALVDDDLPDGYRRITGIKFDGDFWYETYESLTGDDDVTMTLANTSSTGQNVFGSYNGTSAGTQNFSLYLSGGGSTNASYFRYGTQLVRPKFGGNERTITFGKSGTDGFAEDVSVTPDTFTTEDNTIIGMLPNSTSPAYTGSIMGSITVGNRLEWIPCERTNDGTVGYYEKYTAVFLEPTGEGTPIKGAYDYTHSHLGVVGTPETLTISADGAATQTVTNLPMLLSVGGYADEDEIISGVKTGKVGYYIFKGTENMATSTAYGFCILFNASVHRWPANRDCTPFCTHFQGAPMATSTASPNTCFFNGSGHFYFRTDDFSSASDFKTWLAAQYAAGTPVIVLYALANATTEQTTAHSLHTAAGNNVVSVSAGVSDILLECVYKGVE